MNSYFIFESVPAGPQQTPCPGSVMANTENPLPRSQYKSQQRAQKTVCVIGVDTKGDRAAYKNMQTFWSGLV